MTLALINQPPSKVIGPFTQEDWNEILNLRSAIIFMKSQNDPNFFKAIEKYEEILWDIWMKYFPKKAA